MSEDVRGVKMSGVGTGSREGSLVGRALACMWGTAGGAPPLQPPPLPERSLCMAAWGLAALGLAAWLPRCAGKQEGRGGCCCRTSTHVAAQCTAGQAVPHQRARCTSWTCAASVPGPQETT